MTPHLHLDGLSLGDSGPGIGLRLDGRRTLSVFGPIGSGKSRLMKVLAGMERPARGNLEASGKVVLAAPNGLPRKATPQSLAQEGASRGSHHVAEALTSLGLWDVRQKQVSDLAAGRQQACLLLPVLARTADVMLIDGLLDLLDPWTFHDVLAVLQKRVAGGAILVVATQNPDWAEMTDHLLVLRSGAPAFVGSIEDLRRENAFEEIVVETTEFEGVRALCQPFEVHFEENGSELKIRTREGQALAASLLSEGYNDVRSVTIRQPSARQLLENLLR
ncbi:MAG: ATP-binding cassette domain-containing protein [Armatimonadetes bacterium]|nr:ATP-binding cassette domain-containing protein [Armatimonadota bacterium]